MPEKSSKLRALRENRGGPRSSRRPLTLEELAVRAKCSVGHLSDVERGRKRAGPVMVDRLARALGVPIARMRKVCDQTFASPPDAAA